MKKRILFVVCFLGMAVSSWYVFKPKIYHQPLAIQFSKSDLPCTEIEIEGKRFILKIDTGSAFSINLRKDTLDEVENKKFQEMGHWKIANGNEYDAPCYLVPKVRLGNLLFKNVSVQQLEDSSMLNQVLWDSESENKLHPTNIGTIGRPLLEKFNLLVDYYRTRIILTSDLRKIGEMGYFLHQMQKMPFTMGLLGINVQIETKWGPKVFAIDTGSTLNLIRSSVLTEDEGDLTKIGLKSVSSPCTLAGRNLGDINFCSYPLTDKLSDIDGILGAAFLNRHILYIDFSNRILYFRKSQEPPYSN